MKFKKILFTIAFKYVGVNSAKLNGNTSQAYGLKYLFMLKW